MKYLLGALAATVILGGVYYLSQPDAQPGGPSRAECLRLIADVESGRLPTQPLNSRYTLCAAKYE